MASPDKTPLVRDVPVWRVKMMTKRDDLTGEARIVVKKFAATTGQLGAVDAARRLYPEYTVLNVEREALRG